MKTKALFQALKSRIATGFLAVMVSLPVSGALAEDQPAPAPPATQAYASKSTTRVVDEPGFSKKDIKDFIGLSIPILAILLGLGLGGVAIVLEYKKRHNLINACHQERMAALEKGLELPPYPIELVQESRRSQGPSFTPQQCLKPGLMLVAGGLGIGTLVSLVALWRIGVGVGAFMTFSGLGLLAIHRYGSTPDDPGKGA